MKKDLNKKNNPNLKKIITFTEILIFFLTIGLALVMTGTELSENNSSLNKQENTINNNSTAIPEGNSQVPLPDNVTVENDLNLSNDSEYPGLAPENPEFTRKNRNKLYNQAEQSSEEFTTGLTPAPVNLDYLSDISAANASSLSDYELQDGLSTVKAPGNLVSAPNSYDLRSLNKLTSVKNQADSGVCWTFASYGSLESYLKPGENRDFSENHMKNLLSSAYSEGFDRGANDGGNSFQSTAYLARWSGPVDESADSYSPYSTTSTVNLTLQKHVQNVHFIPDRGNSLDNDEIKWALQNYGAIYTTMYYGSSYYSTSNHAYYYNGTSASNHAVTIVGWNDSFDKNRFSRVPPGNGAFIIKNSWGSGWGESGYFYVSYYDSNIGTSNSVMTAESVDNYKSIYQYDPLGWVTNIGYSNPTCWCANVFTAKSDEILKAVSFYTTDSNCNYGIYIYTNPVSGPINQNGLVFSKNGTISTAGYHTVPLDSEIQLRANQKFSVVLKLNTPGYNYPVAVEMPYSGWSSKAKANSGESYLSRDGKSWSDLTGLFLNTNACIKAFTVPKNALGILSPAANFSATPSSGNAPLNVTFTDASTNTPTSWNWSFGDGTNSNEQNPKHTYSAAGNYTVTLTVNNSAGTDTKVKTGFVTVKTIPPKLLANFTATPTSGNASLSVSFIDNSTGSPISWRWSFGDGTYSTSRNTSHTYTNEGKYSVSLTVRNSTTSNTTTKSSYINVGPRLKAPVASFTAAPISGTAPVNVVFTDKSTNSPASWSWKFGDGNTSTQQNPVHTYSKAGKYTVSLVVRNAAGSNTGTRSSYITVLAPVQVPVASFSASPTSGRASLSVQFTDKSTNSPSSWRWNFGDGTSSTSKNPAHTYSKAGTYTVTLTATNTAGSNIATRSSYITVLAPVKIPAASFSASPTSGKASLRVQFTDRSTESPTSWRWNFGDGTYSTSKNPVHTYSKTGKYTVTLTATNIAGSNTRTMSSYITVSR